MAITTTPTVEVAPAWWSGTHRVRPPAETVALLEPHLAANGITRVADVTGLDTIGIPVMMVVRPNSRSLAVSQGKGPDRDAARASGLMESLELHVAERLAEPSSVATAAGLQRAGRRMLDVDALARPSWSRWRPDLPIPWLEGLDVLHDEAVLVPYEAVHVDCTRVDDGRSGVVGVTSNGLASGNTATEAVVHGLCEVIERDAVALLVARPPVARHACRVDPATIDDPLLLGLLDTYDAAGVEVGIWDATTDVGIAAFAVAITDRDPSPFRRVPLARGAGCHPSASVALARALTEAAQCRLTVVAGSRDDHLPSSYRQLRDPDRLAVIPPLGAGGRSFGQTPDVRSDRVEDDLAHVLARLRAVGVRQAAVVELDPGPLPISVVRVLVPGLEGMSDVPGYVAGRRARAIGRTV